MSGELKVDIISSSTNGQDVQVEGNFKVDLITPENGLTINGPLTVDSEMAISNIPDTDYETTTDLKDSKMMMIHGTEQKVSALSVLDALIPPGTVFPFAGETIPESWLPCDGRFISIPNTGDIYYKLFLAIGTKWGANGTGTEFRLPDFRGRFLRGADSGQGNDPDASGRRKLDLDGKVGDIVVGDVVGSYQEDAFQGFYMGVYSSISSGTYISERSIPNPGNTAVWNSPFTLPSNKNTDIYAGHFFDDGHGEPRVSHETRPQNAAVNYIIKY